MKHDPRLVVFPIVFSLLLAVLMPLTIISANKLDFVTTNFSYVCLQAFKLAGPLFLSSLALFFLARLVHREFASRCFLVVIVAFVIWGIYIPLSSGKLDGIDQVTLSIPALLAGVVAIVVAFILYKKWAIILILILVGPVLTASMMAFELVKTDRALRIERAAAGSGFLRLSRQGKNVLVFSFDALEAQYINEAIESDEELKQAFAGFVSFNDVAAVAPFTLLSTLITKLGRMPPPDIDSNTLRGLRDEYITTKLAQNGFDVETYANFETGEIEQVRRIKAFTIAGDGNDSYYRNALWASVARIIPSLTIASDTVKFLLSAPWQKDRANLVAKSKLDRHPLSYYKLEIRDFEVYVDRLVASDTQGPGARFHHYVFTHDPITLDKDCKYHNSQDVDQVEFLAGETKCALKKMRSLLDRLRTEGVYGNSLVILASDHGYECQFNKPGASGLYRVSQRWCLSRYTPFMMVKDFQSDGEYRISEAPVSLMDIAKTICDGTLDNSLCENYEGVNLLSLPGDLSEFNRTILVSKGDKDLRDLSDFKHVEIGRKSTVLEFFGFPN